jgi:hypothetical protein
VVILSLTFQKLIPPLYRHSTIKMLTNGTFKDEPEQQHPVTRVPAPWKLQAESYMLFMKLKELPGGIYDPGEEEWGHEKAGKWTGGLGSVLVVRYSDTPVGML